MGNNESGPRHSDEEEEAYNYHQSVLKEGSTPIKGRGPCRSLNTTQLSDDDFQDAREDILEESSRGDNSETFLGSEGSASGPESGSASLSGSNSESNASGVSSESQDLSPSSSSPEKSLNQSASSSGSSAASLPNRIRVIDTDSENEEEVRVTKNPRKQLDFSTTDHNQTRQRDLPRPIPIHQSGSDAAGPSDSGNNSNDKTTGRKGQVKRKADDMEPEELVEMSLPVRKSGGINRPFARKRELRELVLGQARNQQRHENETAERNQTSAPSQTDNDLVEKNEISSGFEHSNNSPFKNFQLRPSSSTAGADLSASAETPREKDKMASSPTQKSASKRSNDDPDPSTSGLDSGCGKRSETASGSGVSVTSTSMHNTSSRLSSGDNSVSVKALNFGQDDNKKKHWTSELPRVNVMASEKRYEGVSRYSPSPSTSDLQNTVLRNLGDRFSFVLADSLNVHICYDDVTKLRTDALVNPTDGQLTHVNDIARTIAMATGPQMTNQCQFFLRQNKGPLETTEVIETYACGSLSGKVGHVVHVAMPIFEPTNEKSSTNKLLMSYLNCLRHINDTLGLVSVVFPCMGAGSYPQDTCINVFFDALLIHLADRKMSSIKSVKFVVNDEHIGNLAIAIVHAHLERAMLEGVDVLMAEALNGYYGNSKFESTQNDQNDQIGRQMEIDTPKKLFRGPPVKRPRL